MKSVTICLFNDILYDQRMIRTTDELSAMGFDVFIVCRKLYDDIPGFSPNVHIKKIKCPFKKGKWLYAYFNLILLLRLIFHKKSGIYMAVDLDTIVPAAIVANLWRRKSVYDAHEYFHEVPELNGRNGTKAIWKKTGKWFVPKMTAAYTVGPELSQILAKEYGTRFEVVRNVPYPVLSEKEARLTDSNPKIILYQGALNEGRGLEQTIKSMDAIPDAELWIAGDGDIAPLLRELVRECCLDDKVKFLGKIKPSDLPAITRKAFIGLNLLEDNCLSYHYSLANKFFDYMQQGIPCINMDLPEYRQINEAFDCSILIPDLSEKTISDGINTLLNNPGLWNRLSENSLKASRFFNWDVEKVNFHKIIDSLGS